MKIKLIYLFCALLFLNAFTIDLPPQIQWIKLFGEKNNSGCEIGGQHGKLVHELSDGGYIIGGNITDAQVDVNINIIRTDSKGIPMWTKAYGDSSMEFILGVYEVLSKDSGFSIIGDRFSNKKHNIIFMQIDLQGNNQLEKVIQHSGSYNQVIQTKDSNFLLCGSIYDTTKTKNFLSVLKLNYLGDISWEKVYYDEESSGVSIDNTDDGGFVVLTSNHDTTSQDAFKIIGLNQQGSKIWSKKYIGFPIFIKSLYNSGLLISYMIFGYKNSSNRAFSVLKNMTGTLNSTHKNLKNDLEFLSNNNRSTIDLHPSLVRNYYTNFQRDSTNSGSYYLMKTNTLGDSIWSNPYTVDSYDGTNLNVVKEIKTYGYLAVGSAEQMISDFLYSDIYILRIDNNGKKLWELAIPEDGNQKAYNFDTCEEGGFIITGSNEGQTFLLKLATDPTYKTTDNNLLLTAFQLNQNYPNPFNPSTTIEFNLPKSEYVELKVYNLLGKEVTTLVSKKLNQGNHTYTFDGKNLASGIYYYQLLSGDYREVKKMILLQ